MLMYMRMYTHVYDCTKVWKSTVNTIRMNSIRNRFGAGSNHHVENYHYEIGAYIKARIWN